MEYCYIYTLSNPITNEVRYIGKANNLEERFKNHLNNTRDKGTHKRNWINSLKKKCLKPKIEILDYVLIDEWQFWETYWISQFKSWGFNLLNYTEGGDGTTFSNKTSFKKGNVSWNTGKANTFICEECDIEFKAPPVSKRRFCSHTCNSINKSKNINNGNFKLGHTSWIKGKKGIKLKPDKNVFQYSACTGEFIKRWNTAKEAATYLNGNLESIGNVCRGKSITSSGYIWSYTFEKKEPIIFSNKTNNKIKNSLKCQ